MKIIILGKKDMAGTNPAIRVKGMSQIRYNFIWDKEIRHYAYEPKDQKEVDDIFRTQGKLYKTLFFSVWLEKETISAEELMEELGLEVAETPKTKAKGRKTKGQPVAEAVESA
ncbi:hypothetical protein CMI37_06550 [Candidatus Pacearchaeota archaeon]|nr:hypothetical protein [Candidatus Pacearchaeota archaeon]|tara:strand:+ start:744 stop:1082 length:339 start_codon:yes stop_codon:yes gene_type:complete